MNLPTNKYGQQLLYKRNKYEGIPILEYNTKLSEIGLTQLGQ